VKESYKQPLAVLTIDCISRNHLSYSKAQTTRVYTVSRSTSIAALSLTAENLLANNLLCRSDTYEMQMKCKDRKKMKSRDQQLMYYSTLYSSYTE